MLILRRPSGMIFQESNGKKRQFIVNNLLKVVGTIFIRLANEIVFSISPSAFIASSPQIDYLGLTSFEVTDSVPVCLREGKKTSKDANIIMEMAPI